MQQTSAASEIRRLVLVPAPATASGRGDELVRRYRLARLRLTPASPPLDTRPGTVPLRHG